MNGRMAQVQIDVVTEAAFPKLMEEILEELKSFRDRINGHYARLLNSALNQKTSRRPARRDERIRRLPEVAEAYPIRSPSSTNSRRSRRANTSGGEPQNCGLGRTAV